VNLTLERCTNQAQGLQSLGLVFSSVETVACAEGGRYSPGMLIEHERSKPHEEPLPGDALREAVEYGADISLLRTNLALSPAGRIRRHEMALNRMRRFQKARFL